MLTGGNDSLLNDLADSHFFINFFSAPVLIAPLTQGLPGGSAVRIFASAGAPGDAVSIPGLGGTPGEKHGTPLQYSCLENPWPEEPGGLQSLGSQRVAHD